MYKKLMLIGSLVLVLVLAAVAVASADGGGMEVQGLFNSSLDLTSTT